jgi:monoamine oxidase
LARRSVSSWLGAIQADEDLIATATGLRGFFLADPDELSLIALVDQFATDTDGPGAMYRIEGGNQRLATALAAPLGDRLRLNCEVVAISQRGRTVRVSVKARRRLTQIACDYAIITLPAVLLRRIPLSPALPAQQHDAIARLKYGRATRTLLQFDRRFWRGVGRPRAFGSALPMGAVWDGNEEQRGRPGILSLLAGGGASDATQSDQRQERPGRPGRLAGVAGRAGRRARRIAPDRLGTGFRSPAAATRSSIRHSTRACARGWRGRAGGSFSPENTPASGGRAT